MSRSIDMLEEVSTHQDRVTKWWNLIHTIEHPDILHTKLTIKQGQENATYKNTFAFMFDEQEDIFHQMF